MRHILETITSLKRTSPPALEEPKGGSTTRSSAGGTVSQPRIVPEPYTFGWVNIIDQSIILDSMIGAWNSSMHRSSKRSAFRCSIISIRTASLLQNTEARSPADSNRIRLRGPDRQYEGQGQGDRRCSLHWNQVGGGILTPTFSCSPLRVR